ncbi:MAG TPA: hypothetical protein VFS08_08135 [Gemmatimonadaceae bacterium]|nr:hypothetical protein [Gemmatimonadaceae bacterium]
MPPPEAPLAVVARGTVRGRTVAETALLTIGDDRLAVVLAAVRRPLELRFAQLEGVSARRVGEGAVLTLALPRGDAIALEGEATLAALAAEIERRATVLPELTRALRAVGARRGVPGTEHDRFFAPLLEARTRARAANAWPAQLAAFTGTTVRASWAALVHDLAAARQAASPPDRRALEAELEDALEGALDSLTAVDAAAGRLRAAADAERLLRWREWVDALARLFVEADRGWLAVLPVLAAAPPPASAGERGAEPRRRLPGRRGQARGG